jgi:hypothetical protein
MIEKSSLTYCKNIKRELIIYVQFAYSQQFMIADGFQRPLWA